MSGYTNSAAQTGSGSTLSIGATPTMIGEIKSSSISGASWATVDVTNFESGFNQEWLSTIRNNGECKLAGNRVSGDAGQILVEAAFGTGALAPFVLQLPKNKNQTTIGDSYAFQALVSSRDFSVEVGKEVDWTVTLKISGAVTPTTGT
jgi:hypothetical protein